MRRNIETRLDRLESAAPVPPPIVLKDLVDAAGVVVKTLDLSNERRER